MRYADGTVVELGDAVELWEGATGVVMAVIEDGQFSDKYPASEWSYLRTEILVESHQAGVVHYLSPEAGMKLKHRQAS